MQEDRFWMKYIQEVLNDSLKENRTYRIATAEELGWTEEELKHNQRCIDDNNPLGMCLYPLIILINQHYSKTG